ncbi:non-heme iron oxygenase ferredoxin subunit [Microlunatus antarcticus]|uniref:3-phenylpropionate/trans-cinnamate dioxygenase ferredoxin subunit n=1 Tax=Microlunatus antarcticus TaxID=53388 RepID=A0A7W5P826_9ACTN|nr:3-phenylpropionate/trans-cinnamate dioxygenase ferredoxin subunit [Microlunatus antarcticus]
MSGGLVRACAVADVAPGSALAVEIDGTEVAIVRTGDRYYAIADECSHASVPLSEGDVDGCTIECYLHGSPFDLRTGQPLGLPATEPVPVFRCRVDGDDVLVDLAARPDPDDDQTTSAPAGTAPRSLSQE